jgi:hypothetical protein
MEAQRLVKLERINRVVKSIAVKSMPKTELVKAVLDIKRKRRFYVFFQICEPRAIILPILNLRLPLFQNRYEYLHPL